MTAGHSLSLVDRIGLVFDHLGLARAHLIACMSRDWGEFVAGCADRICSFSVVAPHLNKGVPGILSDSEVPVLVVAGDTGEPAKRARELASRFKRGELFELKQYASPAWADTAADRTDDILNAISDFLVRAEIERDVPSAVTASGNGEIAEIHYRIEGKGPAIVFMPLSMAPSQWEPLAARLLDRYTVIRLGGPHLGIVSLLEGRARSGYGELVARLLAQTHIAPGETVLEAGCGSGALTRALAKRTSGDAAITAIDLNRYLLSEAEALARRDGLLEAITFEQANVEALSYPDGRFDVAICCTVLEEGSADRMLAELARVVRAGGRVVVMTRAVDLDWCVNLAVPRDLRRKIDALGPFTGAGVSRHGCADSSLYLRITRAGLTPAMAGPQFAIYKDGERLHDVLDRLLAALPHDEERICRDAIRQANEAGILFAAEPFHCAVAVR